MDYKLIEILRSHGDIIITSERTLPFDLKKYQINIKKTDINHFMYYAKLFISDSTTMTSEAAYLGTPSVEFDDYFHEIDQMLELQNKYGLIHCFRTYQVEEFIHKVQELSSIQNLKELHKGKFHSASSFKDAFFMDMIQELIDTNVIVEPIPINGGWCEIDRQIDLERAKEIFSHQSK